MNKRLVAAAVVFGLLPSVAMAQSLRASIAPAARQQTAAEWQKEYDLATKRKSNAQRKLLIGVGASAVGVLLVATAGNDCDSPLTLGSDCAGSSLMSTAGWFGFIGGAAFAAKNLIGYFDASGDLNRLAASKPTSRGALNVHLSDHQALTLATGKSPSIVYRFTW